MMMKKIKISLFLISSCMFTQAYSSLAHRSQTVDLARYMVGWANQVYLPDADYFNFSFAVIPQFRQTVSEHRVARTLFGDDCLTQQCCPTITISGSTVSGRNATDWLADYFGLPTDYQSTVKFKPNIDEFIFDMSLYIGLDRILSGLFVRLQSPLVAQRTKLHASETIINSGALRSNTSPSLCPQYPAGYFAPEAVDCFYLNKTFTRYIGLHQAPLLSLDGVPVFEPLVYGKWGVPCFEKLERTDFSDLEIIPGWNFLLSDHYHLGLGAVIRAPIGNSLTGEFLFENVVGNGRHWELGGLLTGSWRFWNDDERERTVMLWVEATITHLFAAHQCRVFGLKNHGCSSQYMLAQLMEPTTNEFLFANGSNTPGGPTIATVQPNFQTGGLFTAVANLTRTKVCVRNDLQADVAAMMSFIQGGFEFDWGYEFWCKTKEKLCVQSQAFTTKQWALKGDAFVYGFGATDAVTGANAIIPLSATQSTATIHAGNNRPIGAPVITSGTNNQQTNPGIDNPEFGVTSTIIANTTDRIVYQPGLTATDLNQQRTSLQPVLLSNDDVDYSGIPGVCSHKVFANISYALDMECVQPYVGIGGYYEFGRNLKEKSKEACLECCSPVLTCSPNIFQNERTNKRVDALSAWSLWLKAGISY